MRNWLAVGVVGVVSTFVASLGGGCSSSAAPATVSSYCDLVAQAECPPVIGLCVNVLEQQCESSVTSQCNAAATAAQSAGRSFVPGNVSACISALNSVYQQLNPNSLTVVSWQNLNGTCGTGTFNTPCPGSPNDLCQQVFLGNASNGQNCTTNYDCSPGNICGSFGTCGPETDKGEGEGCADPGDLCMPGLVCTLEPTMKAPICTTGAGLGDECTGDIPCSTTGLCGSDGKCAAILEAGNPCTSTSECDPKSTDGDFCDPGTGSCAAGLTLGAGAKDCSAFSD